MTRTTTSHKALMGSLLDLPPWRQQALRVLVKLFSEIEEAALPCVGDEMSSEEKRNRES